MPGNELFEVRPGAVDGGGDEVADDAAHDKALRWRPGLPAEQTA
jgi:hypothetical protein